MRILLIILTLLFSLNASAVDDKSMSALFSKYDQVMDQKKFDLIDEVFTQKFIKASGGKKELINKINELETSKKVTKTNMTWKKGQKGEVYFAKVQEIHTDKKTDQHKAEFIVVKENEKLKIDGTLSDGN